MHIVCKSIQTNNIPIKDSCDQGRQTGGVGVGVVITPPPLNFGRGVECLSTPPPDFEKFFFDCLHMLLCTGYFYIGVQWRVQEFVRGGPSSENRRENDI